MAKVAFLLASYCEDSEMVNPYNAIREAGHEAVKTPSLFAHLRMSQRLSVKS